MLKKLFQYVLSEISTKELSNQGITNMIRFRSIYSTLAVAAFTFVSLPASAAIVSTSGGTIISAPGDVRDDAYTNTSIEGFNEVQGYLLGSALAVDGGTIAAGTRVDSHMIFLNTQGNTFASGRATWTFSGDILGTMSNSNGSLEVASSAFLGAPGTIYPGSQFNARGLEGNDALSYIGSSTLQTYFQVTEPGDWIRVVTVSAIPLPAALPLLAGGLGLIGVFGRRKKLKVSA